MTWDAHSVHTSDLISITECKDILGNDANGLTDDELEEFRVMIVTLAKLAVASAKANEGRLHDSIPPNTVLG